MLASINLALLAGVASAIPTWTLPSPAELAARDAKAPSEASVEKRQNPDVNMCKENGCSDCPFYFSLGSGYPQCIYYKTEQFNDAGYPNTENGQMQVYMNFPDPGADCKYIVRTPVVQGEGDNCGAPALVVQGGPQCAVVVLQSTFIGQFCCGYGDCGAAGTPVRRDDIHVSTAAAGGAGADTMIFQHANGSTIEPYTLDLKKRSPVAALDNPILERAPVAALDSALQRRCGDGDFVVTKSRYSAITQTYVISDTVTCGTSESCSATEGTTVTEERSFSASITVGDPFGIVSATAGFEFSESISREFSGTYMFGPGETGYVAFTPIVSCVQGYFSGDCDNNGEQVTVCTPTEDGSGMTGNRRGVVLRS